MTFLNLSESSLRANRALHTAREISQQPRSWLRTESSLQQIAPQLARFLTPWLTRTDLRIILTGAGSSAFIGDSLAPLLLSRSSCRVEAIATTELLAVPRAYLHDELPTLLVSFGRSGNSPESVAAVNLAERLVRTCGHLVFTCNEQGMLYQRCREHADSFAVLLPPETHDESFAMTSSFTSMMLAAWLSFEASTAGRRVPVASLARATQGLIEQHAVFFQELAAHDFTRVVYLGSGPFHGLAREAALKLLEMTDGKVVSASDSPLGFRHGPKAIVNGSTLVVVFVSNDPYTRRYDLDLLQELRSDGRAGRVLAIAAGPADQTMAGDYLSVADLNDQDDIALLFPYIVCAQLYAFYRSLALGNSPDEPIVSGTLSRVVRGVTIHSL